jgi:hypothetical protein
VCPCSAVDRGKSDVTELYPFLAVRDVKAAVEFYARGSAPSRRERRSPRPTAGRSPLSPSAVTTWASDATQARAVAAGATEMFAVGDQPYGLRQGEWSTRSGTTGSFRIPCNGL